MNRITRLTKLANLFDELGENQLADHADALLKDAIRNPYAYDPKGDQASEDRSSIMSELRRDIRWKLEHSIRDMMKAPFGVFSITLKTKKMGPWEVEYLEPHVATFNSREAAEQAYRTKEQMGMGRQGYLALQRGKDTLRSSGDRGLTQDVLQGGKPQIVG